ncbi:MAG: hypothetical protein IJE57_01235 [Anaerotignum sp.]|nr:hypothetical protein [Anaerotignum sp.]
MKSRLYCAIVCYIMAAVLLFFCVPFVKRMTYPKISAVHITKALEKGEQITKDHVADIEIGALEMPEDLVLLSEESIGRYAAVDLVKGDILFHSKLSQLPMDGEVPKDILPEDETSQLVMLKMIDGSEYTMPETGDVVKLNLFDKKLRDIPELQFVRVLTVIPKEEKEEEVLVTIAVNEIQKKYLNRHREDSFYASVIVRSNEELAEKLLLEQKVYFEEG